MDIRERLRRWSKLRFAILYPLGAFVILFANSDDRSIIASVGFIISGLLIRSWANGYAVKMEKLTTSGPYSFIRHPLYLGTMLIVIGFIIMLKIYYVGGLFLVFMIMVYYTTIKKEEAMLEAKFKDAYIKYKKKIPSMVPTFFPCKEGEKWPFSFKRLIRSQEYKVIIWVIIIIMGFHLKDEFLVEREPFGIKAAVSVVLMFIFGSFDLIGEIIKRNRRKCHG